jgi:hypothetical protein
VSATRLEALPLTARRFLSVTERSRVVLVPVDEIVYLKAELKYITIRTVEREFLLEESLTKLEEEFGSRLVRVHRNCLVARDAIRGFERRVGDEGDAHWEVLLKGIPETLPVSRRQQSIFILNGILAGPVMADVIDNAKQSIFETQFGLMWSHYLECCHGSVFARTAFEYQHWDTSAGRIGLASVLDADLYGVAFAVGFQR